MSVMSEFLKFTLNIEQLSVIILMFDLRIDFNTIDILHPILLYTINNEVIKSTNNSQQYGKSKFLTFSIRTIHIVFFIILII